MNIKCQSDYNNDGWDEDIEFPIIDLIIKKNIILVMNSLFQVSIDM